MVRVRGGEYGDTRRLSWWGVPFLLSFSIHGCGDFICEGGLLAVPKTEPSDLAGGLADSIKPAMKRIPRESSSLAHRSSLTASASLIDKKSLRGQPSLFDLF